MRYCLIILSSSLLFLWVLSTCMKLGQWSHATFNHRLPSLPYVMEECCIWNNALLVPRTVWWHIRIKCWKSLVFVRHRSRSFFSKGIEFCCAQIRQNGWFVKLWLFCLLPVYTHLVNVWKKLQGCPRELSNSRLGENCKYQLASTFVKKSTLYILLCL